MNIRFPQAPHSPDLTVSVNTTGNLFTYTGSPDSVLKELAEFLLTMRAEDLCTLNVRNWRLAPSIRYVPNLDVPVSKWQPNAALAEALANDMDMMVGDELC